FLVNAFLPRVAACEAGHDAAEGGGQRAGGQRDAPASRRRRWCRDGGNERSYGQVRQSHYRDSKICSRWNRASLKYWVAPARIASRGTSPMISLSTISTLSFAARLRIASNAWTREVR